MPLVSVVIPTYNRADVLYYALHSALNQTFSDFEIFVIDDASTDATPSVMKHFDDERIRYIRFDMNRKAGAARNAGMREATGRYIAFLDSDDEWLPTKLEMQVQQLEQLPDDWGCSYTGAYVNKSGGFTRHRVLRPKRSGMLARDLLMSRIMMLTPTFMFRRSCLEHVDMMDESLVRNQDVDFMLRLLAKYKAACIEEPLAKVFLTMNRQLAEVAEESRRTLLDKHYDTIHSLGPLSSRYTYAMAEMSQAELLISEGEMRRGFRCLGRAMQQNPFIPVRRYASLATKALRASYRAAFERGSPPA